MNNSQPNLYDFVHSLSSPLTALRGAVGLLSRHKSLTEDPHTSELIATLERNTARLQQVSDLLIDAATLRNDEVRLQISMERFRQLRRHPEADDKLKADLQPPPSSQSNATPIETAPIAAPPARMTGVALLISDNLTYVDRLASLLAQDGHTPTLTHTAVAGIDRARQIRPDLLILDLDLADQGVLVAQLLSEDPETKTLPLLMLGDYTHADELPLFLPNQLIDRATLLATVVEIAGAMMAAGRNQQEHHPHILIVDDEPDIRRLVALQLAEESYRTTAVGTGAEALYIAQQQPFDLVILDLLLPDLDGFTVLGGLRAHPRTALTPIILLSSMDASQQKVRGLQLGADDYVTKPFSEAELSARVQAAMRRSELEGSANPSTRLPGNVVIERSIRRRIDQQTPFAVCYSDLDNFKAYNDTYGFLKGDSLIQQTARVLTTAVREHGNPDDFVGHIGGDDFIIITTPDRVAMICRHAIAHFDAMAPLFYSAEAREYGYIETLDRQDKLVQFPLVSISIAVVSSLPNPFHHLAEVAQRSVEPKKLAKRQEGSVFVIDYEVYR
ncbi:MAG: response regulator [Chloroflexales bacterium]|nr:response regulator [Chloroflexales bacterium]